MGHNGRFKGYQFEWLLESSELLLKLSISLKSHDLITHGRFITNKNK
jgi:hypothetical protein